MQDTDSETPSVRTRLLRAVRKPSRGLANVRKWTPQCSIEELFEALVAAAGRGHLDVVQELIPLCDPKAQGGAALDAAACGGHLDVVRQLIPVSVPAGSNGSALVSAASGGHAHVLRELLTIPEMSAGIEMAVCHAAYNGHVDAVRELIPVSDPEDCNKALSAAALNGHLDAIHLLLPVSNATAVFRRAADSLVQIIQESGLEAATQSPVLLVLNTLARYVEKEELERALNAVLEAPKQLLNAAPQLTASHAAAQLREATPPANAPRAPRASL